MPLDDFELVLKVHLLGSVYCTQAAWPVMADKGYGRIVMTTSSSGLYGNFGQSNYGAAKMGLVGLMNTLKLEGERKGIRVNTIAPVAATRMTENLGMPEAGLQRPQAGAGDPRRALPRQRGRAQRHDHRGGRGLLRPGAGDGGQGRASRARRHGRGRRGGLRADRRHERGHAVRQGAEVTQKIFTRADRVARMSRVACGVTPA